MTAPQRVDPARIRQINRAQLVANTTFAAHVVLVMAAVPGLLAKLDVIPYRWDWLAPVGVVGGLLAFVAYRLADQLADRYRQPVAEVEQ